MFRPGLSQLRAKFDKRFYTTALDFARELCEVISAGINTEPQLEPDGQPRTELTESPTKPFSRVQERKKLGKRIIKMVQPQLEAALKAEADLTSKPPDSLQKEFERMIEGSLEVRKLASPKPKAESLHEADQDVAMTDAPGDTHITVAGLPDVDAAAIDGDRMDVDELNIEFSDDSMAQLESTVSVNAGEGITPKEAGGQRSNGVEAAPTPPDTNGYVSMSQASNGPTPLTPPQSNGSLGHGTDNALTEGGIMWHLKAFEPVGTSAMEEQWAGRDVLRSLSEELTDMDEAELNDLEFNVEDSTITASPVDMLPGGSTQHLVLPGGGLRSGGTRRKTSGVSGVNKKRLRSSARRR